MHEPSAKADLAPGLRNRFTELYYDGMADQADITKLVTDYLGNLSLQAKQISSIVTFYAQVGTDYFTIHMKAKLKTNLSTVS